MKKLFFLPVIVLFALSSCKKSSSSSAALGTINATIDGTATTFNTEATAVQSGTSGAYSLIIIGFQGAAGTSSTLDITLGSSVPFAAGTLYSDTTTSANGNLAEIAYVQQPGEYEYSDVLSGPVDVTITNITSTTVQGTFSGIVGAVNGGTPASHTITKGSFNLKLTNQ